MGDEYENKYYMVGVSSSDEPSGLKRRELFLDSSLDRGANINEKYAKRMMSEGRIALHDYKLSEKFNCEINEGVPLNATEYIYGKDYKLGDLVTAVTEDGKRHTLRVSEFIISDSTEGLKMYPSLSEVNDEVIEETQYEPSVTAWVQFRSNGGTYGDFIEVDTQAEGFVENFKENFQKYYYKVGKVLYPNDKESFDPGREYYRWNRNRLDEFLEANPGWKWWRFSSVESENYNEYLECPVVAGNYIPEPLYPKRPGFQFKHYYGSDNCVPTAIYIPANGVTWEPIKPKKTASGALVWDEYEYYTTSDGIDYSLIDKENSIPSSEIQYYTKVPKEEQASYIPLDGQTGVWYYYHAVWKADKIEIRWDANQEYGEWLDSIKYRDNFDEATQQLVEEYDYGEEIKAPMTSFVKRKAEVDKNYHIDLSLPWSEELLPAYEDHTYVLNWVLDDKDVPKDDEDEAEPSLNAVRTYAYMIPLWWSFFQKKREVLSEYCLGDPTIMRNGCGIVTPVQEGITLAAPPEYAEVIFGKTFKGLDTCVYRSTTVAFPLVDLHKIDQNGSHTGIAYIKEGTKYNGVDGKGWGSYDYKKLFPGVRDAITLILSFWNSSSNPYAISFRSLCEEFDNQMLNENIALWKTASKRMAWNRINDPDDYGTPWPEDYELLKEMFYMHIHWAPYTSVDDLNQIGVSILCANGRECVQKYPFTVDRWHSTGGYGSGIHPEKYIGFVRIGYTLNKSSTLNKYGVYIDYLDVNGEVIRDEGYKGPDKIEFNPLKNSWKAYTTGPNLETITWEHTYASQIFASSGWQYMPIDSFKYYECFKSAELTTDVYGNLDWIPGVDYYIKSSKHTVGDFSSAWFNYLTHFRVGYDNKNDFDDISNFFAGVRPWLPINYGWDDPDLPTTGTAFLTYEKVNTQGTKPNPRVKYYFKEASAIYSDDNYNRLDKWMNSWYGDPPKDHPKIYNPSYWRIKNCRGSYTDGWMRTHWYPYDVIFYGSHQTSAFWITKGTVEGDIDSITSKHAKRIYSLGLDKRIDNRSTSSLSSMKEQFMLIYSRGGADSITTMNKIYGSSTLFDYCFFLDLERCNVYTSLTFNNDYGPYRMVEAKLPTAMSGNTTVSYFDPDVVYYDKVEGGYLYTKDSKPQADKKYYKLEVQGVKLISTDESMFYKKGSNFKIYIVPENGYHVKGLTITGTDSSPNVEYYTSRVTVDFTPTPYYSLDVKDARANISITAKGGSYDYYVNFTNRGGATMNPFMTGCDAGETLKFNIEPSSGSNEVYIDSIVMGNMDLLKKWKDEEAKRNEEKDKEDGPIIIDPLPMPEDNPSSGENTDTDEPEQEVDQSHKTGDISIEKISLAEGKFGYSVTIFKVSGNVSISAHGSNPVYSVSYHLSNCYTTNSSTYVPTNGIYETTLICDDGYTLDIDTIEVEMNGVNITSKEDDSGNPYLTFTKGTNGEIYMRIKVDGYIIIKANAKPIGD